MTKMMRITKIKVITLSGKSTSKAKSTIRRKLFKNHNRGYNFFSTVIRYYMISARKSALTAEANRYKGLK